MNTRLLLLAALCSAGCAVIPAASAAGHDHASTVTAHSVHSAPAALAAHASFDRDGTLWAVHKVSGHVAVSHSRDLGQSWSSPVLVTAVPEATDPGGDAGPKIATGPDGEIYVTWTKPLGQPFSGEIRFSRSVDAGRTFLPPVVVHRDRQEITHRFGTLAVNRNGQVFVAWIDKRDLVAARESGATAYRGAAVYFAVSDDRGATFRGDYKAADHSCECCRLALGTPADGSVVAMWRHVFDDNIRDHAMATLHADGRASPVRRVTFDNWKIDGCPHHGPAVAPDSAGRTHAVWFSGAPERHGVYYGRLGDAAANVPRRIGSAAAGQADVAVAGAHVVIAWREILSDRTRLRALASDDGGDTWTECELGSVAGGTGHPRVLVHAGRFHVFWPTAGRPLSVTTVPELTTRRGESRNDLNGRFSRAP